MNNHNKSSRSQRILDKLLIKQEFRLEVGKIRAIFGIPPKGFNDEEKEEKWRRGLAKKKNIELIEHSRGLTEKCMTLLEKEAPRSVSSLVEGLFNNHLYVYIVTGNAEGLREMIGRNPINIWLRGRPRGGFILTVGSDVDKNELLQYIKLHFNGLIRAVSGDKKPERIRSYSKAEHHQKIVGFLDIYIPKTIRELRKIAGVDKLGGYSKYDVISKILMDKCGIEETADNLRTIHSRLKKRKITL